LLHSAAASRQYPPRQVEGRQRIAELPNPSVPINPLIPGRNISKVIGAPFREAHGERLV
jgi:hypothetical protein